MFLAPYCFFTSCSLSSCPGSSGVSKFTEWLMVIIMIMISCNVDIICFFFYLFILDTHANPPCQSNSYIKNWVVKLVVILDILYYYQAILCRKTFSSSLEVEFVCQKLVQLDRNEFKKLNVCIHFRYCARRKNTLLLYYYILHI